MWLFGKANKKEIKELKRQGWEVQVVDIVHFNHALDSKYDPKHDPELKTAIEGDDVMIAVFVDNDIVNPLTEWHNEEKAHNEMRRRQELLDLREKQADEKFERATHKQLEIPKDCDVLDHEGWENNGDDSLIKKFYYENPEGGDSLIGSFIVDFKKDSDKVIDFHSNT